MLCNEMNLEDNRDLTIEMNEETTRDNEDRDNERQ